MSCDNIQGNGDVARRQFTAYAELRDPDLAAWIRDEVPFPNSMVDRITPVTSDEDRERLAQDHGIADAWPVVCEPYIQWVLEDRFAASSGAEDVDQDAGPASQPTGAAAAVFRGFARGFCRVVAGVATIAWVRRNERDGVSSGNAEIEVLSVRADATAAWQRAQVGREDDPNHGSVCTSTDITFGRSETMAFHVSPPLAEP